MLFAMYLDDYSPPSSPSLDQQRDALRKGLGRAMGWAMDRRLDDGPFLEACLHDQRFDQQVEDSRADWLWGMIQAGSATAPFRTPILHALYDLSEEDNADQLCGLARCYAATGDATFRSLLYKIVDEKPFADWPRLGEREIVALDGEQGFLFVAAVRGRSLLRREWEWDDSSLVQDAIERLGEARVGTLLAASADDAVGRFRAGWQQDRRQAAEHGQHPSGRDEVAAIPLAEVLRAAADGTARGWLRTWGRLAHEADLRAVLQRLRVEPDPRIVANLLKVFSARPLPEFEARLIELCHHADNEVRRRAFRALKQNTHPLVREFALSELQEGVSSGETAALFINNYQIGDENRILEALQIPRDECELHWLLMEVVKVLEKNPGADCSRLGVIGYAMTPCSNCRYFAARLLLHRRQGPPWLRGECRCDADEECHKLADHNPDVGDVAEPMARLG